MSNYSRRDFLAHSATAGMLALQADRLLAAGDAATARPADMAIARWKGPEPKDATDPQLAEIAGKLTHQAIEALGGMGRFVKRGDVVWVKPNIGWDRTPEQAGNTNPELVATLVAMCLEAGAKAVKVGDNTVHAAVKTYESSGIAAAVKTPGGKMVFLDKQRFKETAIHGERVKTVAALSRHHRMRPGDQRRDREAPRALQCHVVHEELHGRDGQPRTRSTRTLPPALPTSPAS